MKTQFSGLKIQLVLAVCLFTFYSCDKVKDATTTEIKVSSVSFELDNITVEEDLSKSTADGLNIFNATHEVTLNDIQGLSDDAIKYASKIESVETGDASVTITTTNEDGTVVKEFVLTATGISSSINISQYNLGEPYTDFANMQDFVTQLLMKLFVNKSANLTASGKTDITSGENIKIKITIEDITLVAGLLN